MKEIFKLAIITVLASLIFSNQGCSSRGKDTKQESGSLKIITYNVWYGFSKVPERKEAWLEWIKAREPDVLSLQELNGYTREQLTEDARFYGHDYSVLLKEDGFPTGISSRFPIEDVKRITEGFHHGLMRIRIQQIYYYVIHLHPSDWEFRKREIQLIIRDIQSLPENSDIILAGDFNTFSPLDSLYYNQGRLEPFFNHRDKQFREKNLHKGQLDYSVIQEILDFGFIDLEAADRGPDYSFTGSFPTRVEKEGEHGDQRRLDYVFASKGLRKRLLRADIIADDSTFTLSDHLPVMVEFKLK